MKTNFYNISHHNLILTDLWQGMKELAHNRLLWAVLTLIVVAFVLIMLGLAAGNSSAEPGVFIPHYYGPFGFPIFPIGN